MINKTEKKNQSHHPRKRFGQNFLRDQNIIQQIVQAILPQQADKLVEIGPGKGALTKHLINTCEELNVIEIDRDLVEFLRTTFTKQNLKIYSSDALKFDFSKLFEEDKSLRIIGNLPYNISTPLIFHLLNYSNIIKDMHFMLQQEVVDRIVAPVGTAEYGRLSIMVQYNCKVEKLFIVPAQAFYPLPKVISAIVRLKPYPSIPFVAENKNILDQVVRTAFNQRRKTLRNNFKKMLQNEHWQTLNIDPGLRPEKLSLQHYVSISNLVNKRSLNR